MKTIIFDYDGTLHDSTYVYTKAFRRVYDKMVEAGDAPLRIFEDKEITVWLGYTATEMWDRFMPQLSDEKKAMYSSEIGGIMAEYVHNSDAVLYKGALETLQYLKNKGYTLLYLSNCSNNYMQLHAECFDLNSYFDCMYCSGDYGYKTKYEIFEHIKAEYPGPYMIVGDRFHDMEVAQKHGISSAGCAYGFGEITEIEDADIILEDIRDLMKIL